MGEMGELPSERPDAPRRRTDLAVDGSFVNSSDRQPTGHEIPDGAEQAVGSWETA
jgi:hypothetical protein